MAKMFAWQKPEHDPEDPEPILYINTDKSVEWLSEDDAAERSHLDASYWSAQPEGEQRDDWTTYTRHSKIYAMLVKEAVGQASNDACDPPEPCDPQDE